MPLPDFGNGPKTGQGSWGWGIGAGSQNGAAAGAFLDYLLNDTNVAAMTEANGAPPATETALAKSELYGDGGPLQLFADQLASSCEDDDVTPSCVAVTRPVSAGYPVVTSEFSEALNSIYGGADPASALSGAARAIDQDFSDNNGYQIP
jgi:multiple sugar transport system substrate-binding protein